MKLVNVYTLFFLMLFAVGCKRNSLPFYYELNDNTSLFLISPTVDTLNGDRVYFYETGELWGRVRYKNGKKHGVSYFYYKSGNTKSYWIYYEGHPDGHCYNYADNYAGYPIEFFVYGGNGQLVYRSITDSSGKKIFEEGGVPKNWLKK